MVYELYFERYGKIVCKVSFLEVVIVVRWVKNSRVSLLGIFGLVRDGEFSLNLYVFFDW